MMCYYLRSEQRVYIHREMPQKNADGKANSGDPGQTAPRSRIWVCTVCQGLSIQRLRIIKVSLHLYLLFTSLLYFNQSIFPVVQQISWVDGLGVDSSRDGGTSRHGRINHRHHLHDLPGIQNDLHIKNDCKNLTV